MKNLDNLSLYQKYDHKIYLEKKKKLDYILLYKMFSKKLDAVKRYFDFYLIKKFIQTSLVSYFLLVLFVKKQKERIYFCVYYKRLNTIIKKNYYSISFIEKILTQVKDAKYFTKIDI